MCGVFREGRMPSRKIPPAPRTRCEASGAKAGCAFFAPGFFAQAKKGGSRRHGAKAFDLVRLPPVIRKEQEQLAALAPLIRRFAPPSPVNGRRAGWADQQAGRPDQYFHPNLRYAFAKTQAGPISKYRRSVKKLGLRPSNSLLWPTNCAIHATTNTPTASHSRNDVPNETSIQRVSHSMAMKIASIPRPIRREALK